MMKYLTTTYSIEDGAKIFQYAHDHQETEGGIYIVYEDLITILSKPDNYDTYVDGNLVEADHMGNLKFGFYGDCVRLLWATIGNCDWRDLENEISRLEYQATGWARLERFGTANYGRGGQPNERLQHGWF